MKPCVLVVGATGTVGAEVVRSLLSKGARVRALIRPRPTPFDLPAGVETCAGDLTDRASIASALDGVTGVFFVTPHGADEETKGRVLIEACEAKGVERLVFSAAYHPSYGNRLLDSIVHLVVGRIGPHYVPKLRVERRVRASRLDTVVLLPSNFYQNDETFRAEILEGVYPQPLGAKRVNRVDCRDIGDAAARALLDDAIAPGAYPLVGPRSLSGEESAAVWAAALGREVRYAGDDVEAWSRMLGDRFDEAKKRDFERTFGVIQRFGIHASARELEATTRLLGRAPRAYEDYVRERVREWEPSRGSEGSDRGLAKRPSSTRSDGTIGPSETM